MNMMRAFRLGALALIVSSVWGCHPTTSVIAKTKYTCSNGSVEVASETTCGDRKHCEDLCQHSGGSGGSCASTEYFCSVAQP